MSVFHTVYDRVNNSVFRRFLKVSSDVDDVTVGDRQFLGQTAATGNAQSPIVGCLVRGTINNAVDDERIRRPVSRRIYLPTSSVLRIYQKKYKSWLSSTYHLSRWRVRAHVSMKDAAKQGWGLEQLQSPVFLKYQTPVHYLNLISVTFRTSRVLYFWSQK